MAQAPIELLYWDGCPSHPQALAQLREALAEIGALDTAVTLTEITTPAQAQARGFVGSPTILVAGSDVVAPEPGEPASLSCRVYRRRDGRFSPTPDPEDLRAALRARLAKPTEET